MIFIFRPYFSGEQIPVILVSIFALAIMFVIALYWIDKYLKLRKYPNDRD